MQNIIFGTTSSAARLVLSKTLSSTCTSPSRLLSSVRPISASSCTSPTHHSSLFRNAPPPSSLAIKLSRSLSSTSAKSSESSTTTTTTRAPNAITSHNVIVEGVPLHYEKAGHGPHIVLLLPGALGSGATDFAPQLAGLDPDLFTLIAWDPPGYGQSRPHEKIFDGFYRSDAEMAIKLMQSLNYPRYSVLGWSDGGITGMILAASPLGSAAISRLIIWGSNAYVNEEDRTAVRKVRNPQQDWSPTFRKVFTDMYGEELFGRLWDRWVAYYMTLDDICKADLPRVKCPVLILHGDLDPMLSTEHPVYLVNNLKNSTLFRFPQGKHNIHQRYAAEFNKLVEDFLTTK